MRLDEIGFYTMCDERAKTSSKNTPLYRAELILTDKCNFSCPYCMKLKKEAQGTLPYKEAKRILKLWVKEGLKNVRFSGGEPTLYPNLKRLVTYCKKNNVEHIAISTNGSADLKYYKEIHARGVNDFSISLDSGCCSVGKKLTGGVEGAWEKVVKNIREISKFSYVTVGMVFTEDNIKTAVEDIKFADALGVADIRIISSAQYNQAIENLQELPKDLLDRHPILKYRVNNYIKGIPIRGMTSSNCNKCKLVLDDMAVAGKQHWPCIIYLRQHGDPIGEVSENMREEREKWYKEHDSLKDPICRRICLDTCVAYNDRAREFEQFDKDNEAGFCIKHPTDLRVELKP